VGVILLRVFFKKWTVLSHEAKSPVGVEKVRQHKVFLPASIANAKVFFSRCD
jgi:hypothetical protein